MAPLDTLLLLTLTTLIPLAASEIRFARIRSDGRPLIPLDEFGFTANGAIELNASRISLPRSTHDVDLSHLGFFLANRDSWIEVLRQLDDGRLPCPLLSDLVLTVYSFRQLSTGDAPLPSSAGIGCFYTAPEPGEFILVFANCLPNLEVSMDVTTAMYNVDPATNRRDYLPVGATALPGVYLLFSLAYFALAGLWAYVLHRKRPTAFHVHYLMLALVVLKALDLLCESVDMSYVNSTGTAHGWDVPFYVFSFLKGVTLFTVIVLVGAGWSILKPYLQGSERTILVVVIPLQVVSNVAQVVIDESHPYANVWLTWKQVLVLVDVVCCCAVLFPIAWSIKNLRAAARVDGKAAIVLRKLTLFKQYYMVVIGYIYFTRVAVFALENMASYEYRCIGAVAAEVVTLGFYVFTGYKFRPLVHNPYFALDDDEEENAAEAMKLEYEVEL